MARFGLVRSMLRRREAQTLVPFVPAFASVRGVNITTPLVAGTVLNREVPIVVRWDGEDLGAWVTMKLVVQRGSYRQFVACAGAGVRSVYRDRSHVLDLNSCRSR